jgi:hypothetical protein
MAKTRDTKKETKKKPAQTIKEKRKAKQEKKKDKVGSGLSLDRSATAMHPASPPRKI